jgi:hypothetical protein
MASLENGLISITCPQKPECSVCSDHSLELYLKVDAAGADWYFRGTSHNKHLPATKPWVGPFRTSFHSQ